MNIDFRHLSFHFLTQVRPDPIDLSFNGKPRNMGLGGWLILEIVKCAEPMKMRREPCRATSYRKTRILPSTIQIQPFHAILNPVKDVVGLPNVTVFLNLGLGFRDV